MQTDRGVTVTPGNRSAAETCVSAGENRERESTMNKQHGHTGTHRRRHTKTEDKNRLNKTIISLSVVPENCYYYYSI